MQANSSVPADKDVKQGQKPASEAKAEAEAGQDLAQPWYALFSRGARDWLRHSQKVRDAVQAHLPELITGADVISGPQQRQVQVPVRLLEHARFRLAPPPSSNGAGQGAGQPGDILRAARPLGIADEAGDGEGSNGA